MRNTVLKEMDKCSGCGLCETVCPAQAIKMEYDKSGFIYPVIQKEKCIDCGLCERKCVVKTVSVEYPRTCYAGVHLDEKIRAKSSSGVYLGTRRCSVWSCSCAKREDCNSKAYYD